MSDVLIFLIIFFCRWRRSIVLVVIDNGLKALASHDMSTRSWLP